MRRTAALAGAATFCAALAFRSHAQTPTPTPSGCFGDCDGSDTVTVDEIITLAQIGLGNLPIGTCPWSTPCSCTGEICIADAMSVTVDCIMRAVNAALNGCPTAGLLAAVHFDRPHEPINQQLIGTGGAAPLADVNQALAAMVGPPWIRLDVGFEDAGCPDDPSVGALYDAANHSFNYCQLDRRLEDGKATGATPLLIIDYTPPVLADPACAATNGHGLGIQHCPPADYGEYGVLVEAMIRHVYAAYGVTDFEVWNEPDGLFLAGTFADYLMLYRTCNDALEHAERGLGVAPGTLRLGGPATTAASYSWTARLLGAAVQNPTLRVDFLSWHNYANSPFGDQPDPLLYAGTYAHDAETVRGWAAPFLAQRPDLHPQLWIDEWNVNAFFDPRMDTSYDAAFMAAALHGMQDARLDRAARFNTWDSSPATPVGFHGNWGLFTNDGQVRPALHAFALWHQMAPARVAVELFDNASRTRDMSIRTRYTMNLVASVDDISGRATILLYSFAPSSSLDLSPPYCGGGAPAVDMMLVLDGLPDGDYRLAQQRIDCATPIQPLANALLPETRSALTVAGGQASARITVPADAVLFLSMTRNAPGFTQRRLDQ